MDQADNSEFRSNFLCPKVELASESEIDELFKEYGISKTNLPLIKSDDASLQGLNAEAGSVVRIGRTSRIIGKPVKYYRLVVEA